MGIKEFLRKSENHEIDFNDFSSKIKEEISKSRKYGFFITESSIDNAHGIPVSVKDNICTKGIRSTAGSSILKNYVPVFDATCISRIKQKNCMVIGKTAMDEFGFGTFSTNCAYGIPKNPWDEKRSCGGSSGGSAGLTSFLSIPHISIAESTGGSISCPASFCGIVGFTPTYGLVSRYGLIDYANSLDKIGIMAKSVWDSAYGLSLISGYDKLDSTSLKEKQKNYTDSVCEGKKFKIGVPKEYFKGIDNKVEKCVWSSIKDLEKNGFEIKEISLPSTKYALSSYYIIACAEASTNLAKFCGLRYGLHENLEGNFNEYFSKVREHGFGTEAKRRIMLGTFARMAGYRSQYYLKALKVRTMIINEFKKSFKGLDGIMAPTMPILPPKFDEIEKLTPIENYQCDVLTVPVNLAGMPHLSLPCGFAIEGGSKLPVGLHIMCDHLQEEKMISIASSAEKILGVKS